MESEVQIFLAGPSSTQPAAAGGTGSIQVTAGSGCSWAAASNAAWITVTGGASGAGNGTVAYSVAVNPGAARAGTITVAGQTFTVTQAAAQSPGVCTFTLSLTSVPVPAVSSGTTLDMRASASTCSWSAVSNASWIVITSASTGTGNGAIAFSVGANPTTNARSGTLTVAGATVTVTQAAGSTNVSSIDYVLQLDSGRFTTATGMPQGMPGVWFVNRLKPPGIRPPSRACSSISAIGRMA
ncbi:MAG: BACON domain-containing protein [Acidobacteria bacterium]|nr:BACON domain-containing protein [Acidobacteriota bacterium]